MCNELQFDSKVVLARVDALLRELERSRSWLARRMGVSEMWVSRRLAGQTTLAFDDVPRLAMALEVEVAALLQKDLAQDRLAVGGGRDE